MNELLDQYLRDAEERIGWAHQTCVTYRIHLRRFLAWFEKREGRPITPADYTADTLQTHDTSRRRAGKAQRTRAAELCAAQSFARYLLRVGQITAEECGRIKDLKVRVTEKPRQKWATTEQVQALFAACGRVGDRHSPLLAYRQQLAYAVLAVLAYCALRRSEVYALQAADVELDAAVPQLTVRQGKGDKTRVVWLHADAVRHLRAWFAIRPQSPQLFAVPVYKVGSTETAPMTTGRLLGLLREITRLSDMPDKTVLALHAFRRFAATNLLKVKGCTLAHVAAFLGHSSIQTSLVYIGMNSQELQQLVMNMEVEVAPEPPPPLRLVDAKGPARRRVNLRRQA